MADSPYLREKALLSRQIPLAQRYSAVQGISRAIGSHCDADALFRALVAELRPVINSRTIGIVHYDGFWGAIQWCALDIEDYPLSFTSLLRWENSACRWVYEYQQPTVECLAQFGMLSACVLPLTT